jgi:hypothetical protein
VRGKSLTSRAMNIHGGRVLSTYTHVSDQWSTYGTKQIVPTAREGHFTLDELLGNATDLPITEHATDTHGATLVNFGLFDLVGNALTPRIRDLGKAVHPPAKAAQRAHAVRQWLLHTGVVVDNPVPDELWNPCEFLAGPHVQGIASDQDVDRKLWNTGVEVLCERQLHHPIENYRPPGCPRCSTPLAEEVHTALIEPWIKQGEPSASAPSAATTPRWAIGRDGGPTTSGSWRSASTTGHR